ncbi:MAG TPA: aminopeptidase [Caldithrix abyssi]|uniref:Aminopeptidase n=1 Tax=Caldithrix abyssi TaxID=187145 RepID=A0A7V4U1Z6_CALAY|nr:aminopeptidase [Caldithrix abyssi]
MQEMKQAARTALTTCLGLKGDESLLIVTDDNKLAIGKALYEEGQNLAREALMLVMPPAEVNGQEPPPAVAEMMAVHDVVVCPTTKSVTHTDARRKACKQGARVATMPGITEDIMIRTLKADYNEIARRTLKLSEILDAGRIARVTTSLGTDIVLPIEGIKAISSTGLILEKGQGGNLPSGESFLMPEEGKSNGVFYIDASVATIGKIETQPIKVVVENGYAVSIEGGLEAEKLRAALEPFGQAGRTIAELGIGTNHEASITGLILEDEKVMGTIHIAFGNNISMGGTCNVGVHIDGVITRPTVYVDERCIMDEGKLLV